ncbi:MAG: PEP-CTERM sorting domain-containing protein [Rubrivivax sp.]
MKLLTQACLLTALGASLPAFGANFAVVGLGFEGLQLANNQGTYQPAQVWEFYDGAFSRSADGSVNLVIGPDYDVAFNASALALRSTAANGISNFAQRFLDTQGGTPLTNLGVAALFYDSNAPVLNFASGFGVGFSFYYASTAAITVTLFDGFDASGTPLGSDSFRPTPTCTLQDNSYCAWSIGAISFAGVARSVRFDGLQSQALFDNVTFGSITPIDGVIPVPEPATYALAAIGLLVVGAAARRRRRA